MQVRVRHLCGVGAVPTCRKAAGKWLAARGISAQTVRSEGGPCEIVALSDLPIDVRRAYELRQIETSGLEPGEYNAEAHDRFAEATPAMQSVALRRAEIARFLIKAGASAGRGVTGELVAAVYAKFGTVGTNAASLRRILVAVSGVDTVNFAPALCPNYSRAGKPQAEISEQAWAYFMTTIRDAAPWFPIKQAWRDVRDVARKRGWAWPKYVTVWRRWDALPEAQKLAARQGREEAVKALNMPVQRDKTTLAPLQIASLDGRTLDFWVDFGDGKAVRPVMIALVDVATNYVLGYELTRSENAVATSRLIRTTCRTHGIFGRLYTDNGSAFTSHQVARGAVHKWRGKGKNNPDVKPLGVCHHLGIELTFAIPENAQAKIVERTFATLSRVIDDRPEFKGAHAGHAPGAAPDRGVIPVPLAVVESVVRREVDRHNRETGRTGQGARGRSYEQMFSAGLQGRVLRKPTAQQLYYAGLTYTPASVDRYGRVSVDTWTYGGPETQDELLRWHNRGQILVGRDPDDFSAPAVAFDEAGRLICKGIMPVKTGVYDSVEGAREAAKNRKVTRSRVAQAEEANGYLSDAEFAAALTDLAAPEADDAPRPAQVVGGRFGAPLQPARKAKPKSAITPEMLENFDRAIGFDMSRAAK